MNPFLKDFKPSFPVIVGGDIAIDPTFSVIAILTESRKWLYRRRAFKFVTYTMRDFQRSVAFVALRCKYEPFGRGIVQYLTQHAGQPRLLELAFRALTLRNLRVFGALPMMPDTRTANTSADFEAQWDRLVGAARPGDLIFTFHTNSRLSRFIADIDGGSWSHVSTYAHDGWLFDAGGGGESLVRLEKYRDRNIRVGLYRFHHDLGEENLKQITKLAAEIGFLVKYDWWGAFWAGVRAKLMVGDLGTPNGSLTSGGWYPVAFV